MNPSLAIVLVAALNQGYWIGGQPGEVTLQWAAKSDTPAAEVQWQLQSGDARLGTGQVALPSGAKQAKLTITPPAVRETCDVECLITIEQADNGKTLGQARLTLHIYPVDLLTKVASRLGGKSLAVWDRADGLPSLLKQVKVPFTRIDEESNLQLANYDIIIVGQDQLTERPFGQATLVGHAQDGASVLVLRQTRVKTLAGYALQKRALPEKLTWRDGSVLLQHVPGRALPRNEDQWAIQLPADEPALNWFIGQQEVAGKELRRSTRSWSR